MRQLAKSFRVDAGTFSVQRTLQRFNGSFSFYPPKPLRSHRTIAFLEPIATALCQHLKRELEEREALGPAWEGDSWGALVFADLMGRPLTSFHVSRRFNKLLTRAGLPNMRYHDLRHGAVSIMAAQGAPARTAM